MTGTVHNFDLILNNHQEINDLMNSVYFLERAIRSALTLAEIEKDLSKLGEIRDEIIRLATPTEEFATDIIVVIEAGMGNLISFNYANRCRELLRSTNQHITYINGQITSLEVIRKTKSTLFYRLCAFIGIK